jgi:hypothetical protein
MSRFTPELAESFARLALGHVCREYPNHLFGHVMAGEADVRSPRALHPIFYGSFDWHSCVHAYWLLARVMRRFPELEVCREIAALFAEQLTAPKVDVELAYMSRPESRGFERPYGWAWLLMLQAELVRLRSQRNGPWAEVLDPLARAFADRFREYLPLATYPVRVGTHYNSSFALALTAEYGAVVGDSHLLAVVVDRALTWHGEDRDCQAWEPSQDDFLSSALMEAELMRRVLSPARFPEWFDAFLPGAHEGRPDTLFTPAEVSDRTDGKIAHLDGLNLSRAWCWRSIASSLPDGRPLRAVAAEAADRHLEAALPHVAGDYMGEHWLATFATLALEA